MSNLLNNAFLYIHLRLPWTLRDSMYVECNEQLECIAQLLWIKGSAKYTHINVNSVLSVFPQPKC